jgi:hypothetical protein
MVYCSQLVVTRYVGLISTLRLEISHNLHIKLDGLTNFKDTDSFMS